MRRTHREREREGEEVHSRRIREMERDCSILICKSPAAYDYEL